MTRLLAAALVGAALAGCVGSSGRSTPTSTPTPPTSGVDAETAALAANALVMRGDVGAAWVPHAPPRVVLPAAQDCAQRPDGPLAKLGPDASRDGPSLWLLGLRDVVLYSSSLVFSGDGDVEAYLAVRSSSQWHDCRRMQLEVAQQKLHPQSSVVTTMQTMPAVGTGHLVAYSEFTVMSRPAKGKPAVALATVTETAYRFGHVIVSIASDVSSKARVEPLLKSATTGALRGIAARVGAG